MALVDRWYEILNNLYMHPKISQAEFEAGLKTSRQTLKKNIQLLNQELGGIASITLEDKVYQRFCCFQENSSRKISPRY